jgi:hypothetical protein
VARPVGACGTGVRVRLEPGEEAPGLTNLGVVIQGPQAGRYLISVPQRSGDTKPA